ANGDAEQLALRQGIKSQLQSSLPDYMVPTHFIVL
ncbi:pyoverdine sidechain peptide synthetase I, epsilon-Lys module, partial [Pseudomonas savastanoi pv. glycinea str. race 4]